MAKRRKKRSPAQMSFLENYGKTAPAVPAISAEVKEWRESHYKGATETSRILLNHWFHTDHKLPNGEKFAYYDAQRSAIETLIYVFEIAKTRDLPALYRRFIPDDLADEIRPPEIIPFARYCAKMATGSGKTKVMALAVAWQYLNAVVEGRSDYAKTFLLIAPNVIVFERLRGDFAGGRVFQQDPVIPKRLKIYWDMQFYMRGDAERASSQGALHLTNIQQLHARANKKQDSEPAMMTAVLGSKPAGGIDEPPDFRQRILQRGQSPVMVINDEGHHTHDPKSAWNETIRDLHDSHAIGLSAQLDFSATPRYQKGQLFEWTISDYTLKQAIVRGIVKRPIKGIADIGEISSELPEVRYEPFIVAGVECWREYRGQLEPAGKKPLLFIMMNTTKEADSIGAYLQTKYPDEFGGERTLVIHTDRKGDVAKNDLDKARRAAKEVDREESPINAIVSVLMLREGWDVRNVTVIVGLRPYSSKANILPEQTIGRGLRLMFPRAAYEERVDIIGNRGFINFVEQLEADEDYAFDTWRVGKDKLKITVIQPDPEKAEYDAALPMLGPIIARAVALRDEIEALDIADLYQGRPLPVKASEGGEQTFLYKGEDLITAEELLERSYTLTPQTSQAVVSRYAQEIAKALKLPNQFAALAPKVRDFLKRIAFGREVDLDRAEIRAAISRPLTRIVTRRVFLDALREKLVQPQQPALESAGRRLSEVKPFTWSQIAPACRKTIFNQVPCDNQFEADFARFLDHASDVVLFSKLPIQFGFAIDYIDARGNSRKYYPDFVVADKDGVSYLVETKGLEDIEVAYKDSSAALWAERATRLTGQEWRYVKVLQNDFQELASTSFADCVYLAAKQPKPTCLSDPVYSANAHSTAAQA